MRTCCVRVVSRERGHAGPTATCAPNSPKSFQIIYMKTYFLKQSIKINRRAQSLESQSSRRPFQLYPPAQLGPEDMSGCQRSVSDCLSLLLTKFVTDLSLHRSHQSGQPAHVAVRTQHFESGETTRDSRRDSSRLCTLPNGRRFDLPKIFVCKQRAAGCVARRASHRTSTTSPRTENGREQNEDTNARPSDRVCTATSLNQLTHSTRALIT